MIITERGRPAHVLLTFEDYQDLAGTKKSIVELFGARFGRRAGDSSFRRPAARG